MSSPPLQFWFDFGSTYSYPAALRIEQATRTEALGRFGAPHFVVGDELFWGNDRLDEAID